VGDRKVRRLHYLNHDDARHQTQVVLYEGARIVGAAGLQINPWNTENVWVQHVSVEEAHRGKGFAAKLIEAVYTYAVENKLRVEPSAFSLLGQRLKHIFDRLDALHPQAACGMPHRDHF
jgi:Acetyltransferase (GNAT) family.